MALTPTIKDWVDGTNLNTLNWRRTTLQRLAREYDLKPGECVVFENVAKEKARLVINLNGLVALLIPPIDPARQLSVHLEINEYLRAFANMVNVVPDFDAHINEITERLKRRKKLKEKARRRRAKRES